MEQGDPAQNQRLGDKSLEAPIHIQKRNVEGLLCEDSEGGKNYFEGDEAAFLSDITAEMYVESRALDMHHKAKCGTAVVCLNTPIHGGVRYGGEIPKALNKMIDPNNHRP